MRISTMSLLTRGADKESHEGRYKVRERERDRDRQTETETD